MKNGRLEFLRRPFIVWLVIIAVESVHGTLRTIFLVPALGDHRARQVSVFTGACLILAISVFFVRWMRAETTSRLIWIGMFWTFLTVVFEILLGRFVMGMSWERLAAEYDITTGSLMPLGLAFMIIAPLIADRLRSAGQKR